MESTAFRADDLSVFELSRERLDELPFGVVTLDRNGTILRYNREQETLAGRDSLQTIGLSFFNDVAPCTNVQAFRGRFDDFAQTFDSGVERFAFSFSFRWGRQDVSITMLRKAGHPDINILVRGKALARTEASEGPPQSEAAVSVKRPGSPSGLPAFFNAKELARPVVCTLEANFEAALATRVHPDEFNAVRAVLASAKRDGTTYAVEYRGPAVAGVRRVFQEHGSFDPDPARSGHATIIDVTAERERELESWRVAHYDRLTGLPNRLLLVLRIADAIREAEKNSRIAAVLIVNINGFRSINDSFGYRIGDGVLRTVALRLGECVRSGDTVARIFSDWFAVLLTDVDTRQSAEDTATRLMAAMAEPVLIEGHSYYLTLRVGIGLAPYDSIDPVLLLRAAETATFTAKIEAKNGLRFYSDQIAIDAASNLMQRNELAAALENEEFELFYQPLVDIDSNRVVATEALVRWNHPNRGLVSPAEFIPLADRTGLIVQLGAWVLRTAARQASLWAKRGFDVRMCVNVSTVQFQRPGFVDLVASLVAEFELPPGRLELELTESIMVDGFAEMMETLTRLKTLGIRLAIDDFGTGYSSLSYLKYLPVDTLKVDRSFIIDIVSDVFDEAIATTIFTLTRSLTLECVVEGVENIDQLEKLRSLGCTLVQGYYFCKPARPDRLDALLESGVTHAEPAPGARA